MVEMACTVHANGSGSTRPGTNSAPESTRPWVNSAGSTRPVYFPYGELGYHICLGDMIWNMLCK